VDPRAALRVDGTASIRIRLRSSLVVEIAEQREPDKRWCDFLSVWVDDNRGIGQMREWFTKGLSLSGVRPEDVPVKLNIRRGFRRELPNRRI